MEFVVGIDGGGTKTLLKIADMDGNLLAVSEGGPSNINSVGIEGAKSVLEKLIFSGIKSISGSLGECRSICLGAAGAGRDKEKAILEKIINDMGYSGRLLIADDAITALYGGVGGGEGVVLISGTGSICYGRTSKGESHRAGGWGHIIGDEGSGYWIGKCILTHVMRSYDGREDNTVLSSLVMEHLNLGNPQDLIEFVYRSGAGKREIADLAKLADDACNLGDLTACKILKEAAQDLFIIAKAVLDRLKFNNKIILATSGSILTKSRTIVNEFSEMMGTAYPFVNVIPAQNDSAWGAVIMAFEGMKIIQ